MTTIDRRQLLAAGAVLGAGIAATRARTAAADSTGSGPAATAEIDWRPLGEPEGRGWSADRTLRLTDRLPAHAEGVVPDTVWQRSRHSSGLYHRIRTDAERLLIRFALPETLTRADYLTNASANGVDLYAKDDHDRLRWASWGVPSAGGQVERTLIQNLVEPGVFREYRIYLPLYNQIDDVSIGVPAGSRLEILGHDRRRPVVHYGTSIVQGAGASRPGMSLPARLGRTLDRPVVGLGFSGVGRMEVELAALLAEIDASAYLLDCLPNMTPEQVAERTVSFVQRLRAVRPKTPILLIEDRTRANAWIRVIDDHAGRREAYRDGYRRLKEAGVKDLHYLDHRRMYGTDDEATIDGSHPTDLGVTRYLDVLVPRVRKLID